MKILDKKCKLGIILIPKNIMKMRALAMIVASVQNHNAAATTATKQRYCQMMKVAMMMKMNLEQFLVKRTMMMTKLEKKDIIVFRTSQMTRLRTWMPFMPRMRAASLMRHSWKSVMNKTLAKGSNIQDSGTKPPD